ncbi:hypothetical protein C8Q74DRAFT_1230437 [Fomes fomentarius]|nr:hypothetical protein C8Q74DRAFT_1230437 [Fomes fomentarius]
MDGRQPVCEPCAVLRAMPGGWWLGLGRDSEKASTLMAVDRSPDGAVKSAGESDRTSSWE